MQINEFAQTYGWAIAIVVIVGAIAFTTSPNNTPTTALPNTADNVNTQEGLNVLKQIEQVDTRGGMCDTTGSNSYKCCTPIQSPVNKTVLQCHDYKLEMHEGAYAFTVVN